MAKRQAEEKVTKKATPIQWFVVLIVPLIFALVIAIGIMSFSGIDVIGKAEAFANKVPFLSSVVTTDVEGAHNKEVQKLQEKIDAKTAEIDGLTGQVSERDAAIDSLKQEVENLTAQLEQKESEINTAEKEDNSVVLEEVSSSFKEMEPEAAASIITNMEENLAVSILKQLPTKERGEVFGSMDPTVAAQLTNQLVQMQD
ncbi:MotE family protein [Aquibacillus kalidii]|uniref:MotE family protein n=1 Tax=Aquibacillus kalidii TaxID=2762597 RepID=UPI001647CD79|nr:hypothetical protein [Aquibacillus kalidii]